MRETQVDINTQLDFLNDEFENQNSSVISKILDEDDIMLLKNICRKRMNSVT